MAEVTGVGDLVVRSLKLCLEGGGVGDAGSERCFVKRRKVSWDVLCYEW